MRWDERHRGSRKKCMVNLAKIQQERDFRDMGDGLGLGNLPGSDLGIGFISNGLLCLIR